MSTKYYNNRHQKKKKEMFDNRFITYHPDCSLTKESKPFDYYCFDSSRIYHEIYILSYYPFRT